MKKKKIYYLQVTKELTETDMSKSIISCSFENNMLYKITKWRGREILGLNAVETSAVRSCRRRRRWATAPKPPSSPRPVGSGRSGKVRRRPFSFDPVNGILRNLVWFWKSNFARIARIWESLRGLWQIRGR